MSLNHPHSHSHQTHTDPFGDDASSSPDDPSTPPTESRDLSHLRRTHTTQGYRNGITQGKSTHLQDGFNEGYTLGGRFGLKVGWIKGVIEGLWFLARDSKRLVKMRRDAGVELALEKIFAREFFDEGGIWRYDIGEEGEEEGGVTLDRVVEKHPVVVRWVGRVMEEAERWGWKVEELVHEEEEKEGGKSS